VYSLTDAGRQVFEQAYDDLAASALRYVQELGGDAAIATFAQRRAAEFEVRYRAQESATISQRVEVLASALSRDGYAASTVRVVEGSDGVQLCQHHCPVSHVAAEFPQLCEAETVAFGRILGTHVQRLATIAHGDGVCTTHVPTLGRDDSLVLAGRMSNDSH
jgi:predicted ArsR family transcriptional regulator